LLTGAYQEAIGFSGEALALNSRVHLIHDPVRLAKLEQQSGEAYYSLGYMNEGHDHLEKALALLGKPELVGKQRLLLSISARIFTQLLHRIWPAYFSSSKPQERERLKITLKCLPALGTIYVLKNENGLLLNLNLQGLNLAEQLGPGAELAVFYAFMGVLAEVAGLSSVADTYYHYGQQIAKKINDPFATAEVLFLHSYGDIGMGRLTGIADALGQASETYGDVGKRRRQAEVLTQKGCTHYFLGDFEHSRKTFADMFSLPHIRNDRQFQTTALVGQAQSLMQVGQLHQAITLLDMAKALRQYTEGDSVHTWIYGLLAQAYCRRGERQTAYGLANQIVAFLPKQQAQIMMEGSAGAVETYLGIWEVDTAVSPEHYNITRLACKHFSSLARRYPIRRPRAFLYQGWFSWLKGKHRAAYKAWRKSLDYAQRFAMPYEEARAHCEIGRHLPMSDPLRAEHLKRSLAIFERIGAMYDLEQTRKIVQQSQT
jgi:eukaryotic-like serine/threonine-protein kinase